MSEQPSTLAREAKDIHSRLKVLLKDKGPFDKDIDFMRKNLRRNYLKLLLVHPYAKESEGMENHLWMQTSYVFISDYKQRLAHIDRAIQRPQQQQQGQQQTSHSRHGPVEHRKLLHRFRQFLAEEEKFWTQFLLRYRRSFALDEAHPILVSLGLISENADAAGQDHTTPNSRNQNQNRFPPEDTSISLAPTTPAERESRIAIFSKALICLGDIARYREQYNEAGGRSQIGHDEGGRRGRHRKAGLDHLPSRPRNYDKAKQCYEQAKLLVPSDGNPSHQLAIIAQYQKDDFTSLVHYYRSLCVKHPYDTASENMGTLMHKAFVNWKSRPKKESHPDLANVPKVKIDAFKDKVVVLHALWRLGLAKNDALTLKHAEIIYKEFYSFVADRHLPEDFILQMIILAQGALWKTRMLHESSSGSKSKSSTRQEPSSDHLPPTVIESRVYTHLLSLHRALLEVGIENLKEPLPADSENDLAQRLIVEFRRTLPALRIAGKWLRANFKYVMSDPESLGTVSRGNSLGKEAGRERGNVISASSVATIEFWEKYSEFLRSLSRNFPVDRLPDLTFTLSEDTEMRGFRPLRDVLDDKRMAGMHEDESDDVPHEESEVHPNVVQLMRIKDILNDAKALVGMENSPLALYGNQFVVKGVEAQDQPIPIEVVSRRTEFEIEEDTEVIPTYIPAHGAHIPIRPEEDSMTEETSKTDEDVLRDAFGHLNEDDDEDEIIWDPRGSPRISPVLASPKNLMPAASPVNVMPSPIKPPVSPARVIAPPAPTLSPYMTSRPATRVAATTAEDLLKGFMGSNRPNEVPRSSRKMSDPMPPAPPALLPGNNIWTASQDEQALRFSTSSGQSAPLMGGRHHLSSQSQDLSQSQSIWSSYPTASPNSQHNLVGTLPSAPFAPAPHPLTIAESTYRAVPSAVAAQLFPSSPVRNVGPVGFTSPLMNPQSTQKVEPSLFNTAYMNAQHAFDPSSGYYDPVGASGYHSRHLSLRDSRIGPSVWGNAG